MRVLRNLALAALFGMSCAQAHGQTGALSFGTDAVSSPPAVNLPSSNNYWYWNGNGTTVKGTKVSDYWLNKVGGELDAIIAGCGTTISMTVRNQAWACIQAQTPFTPVQQGGGAGQGTNKVFLGWDGTALLPRIQIDGTDQGDVAMVDEFVTSSAAGSGYVTLPGGTIIERGTGLINTGTLAISLPIGLSNYTVQVTGTNVSTWTPSNVSFFGISAQSGSGFTVTAYNWNGAAMGPCGACVFSWMAMGK